MAQKVNPLALRAPKNFKNTVFHQQTYNNKYLSYTLNEQERVVNFLILFFKQVGLRIHSFNYIKDQKGNGFFCIKYVYMKEVKVKKKFLKFCGLENALCMGLERLGYRKPLSILLYEIAAKIKKKPNLPNTYRNFKIITYLELTRMAQIITGSRGFAFFLTNVICEKLENLRSKRDKKVQGRLILFIEKLFFFLNNETKPTIKGIKIQIKGRINGVARSKKTVITFGTLALQRIDANIDFFYKQALTVFGCFGIKVWVNYVS